MAHNTNYSPEERKNQPGQCPLRRLKPERHAYILLIALFLNVMATLGVMRSLVVFFQPFKEFYSLNYKQSASFVAVFMSAGGMAGFFINLLCKRFGVRPICVICSLMGTLGWLLATHYVVPRYNPDDETRSLGYKSFIMFTGLAGLCHGGVLVNAPVEINRWFPRDRRAVANAIVWSGSSLGAIWIPPALEAIIEAVDNSKEDEYAEQGESARKVGWVHSMHWLAVVQGIILVATCALLKDPKRPFLDQSNDGDDDSYDEEVSEKPLMGNEDSPISSNSKIADLKGKTGSGGPVEPTLKELNKYRLYKVYIAMQIFYGLWRSGVVTYLVIYAREVKGFEPMQASLLVTIWAVMELLCRPAVGHFANDKNRFTVIAVLFILQSVCTAVIPLVPAKNYVLFAALIGGIGCLQGGTGGLFMTAAIDAVGVNLARYAYSVENTIDVIVAGGVVHLYGSMVDKNEDQWNNPENKIFYYAATFILIASVISLIGSNMKQFQDHARDERRKAKVNRQVTVKTIDASSQQIHTSDESMVKCPMMARSE